MPAGVKLEIVQDAGERVSRAVANVAGGADRGRAADRAGGVPLPQLLALDGDHRPGAAGLGAGRLHRRLGLRLHPEHDVAARPVARDRHPDRRRHRGAGEHRAPHRDGEGPHAGLARGHRRDRARRGGHDLLDRRGVRAGGVHVWDRRAVVQAVRADHRLRGAGVPLRVASRSTRCSRPTGPIRRLEAHERRNSDRPRRSTASTAGSTARPSATRA